MPHLSALDMGRDKKASSVMRAADMCVVSENNLQQTTEVPTHSYKPMRAETRSVPAAQC